MNIIASTPNISTLAVRREPASKLVYVNGHVASYRTKRQSQGNDIVNLPQAVLESTT